MRSASALPCFHEREGFREREKVAAARQAPSSALPGSAVRTATHRRPLHAATPPTLGNDLDLPLFPRISARRPDRCPACPGSRCTSPTTTTSTAGDRPDVLVMNPAAFTDEHRRRAEGRHGHRQHRRVPRSGTLDKARYSVSPLADGSLADYHVHEVALILHDRRRRRDRRGYAAQARSAPTTSSALAMFVGLYHRPAGSGTYPSRSPRSSRSARRSSRSTPWCSGQAGTTARCRRTSRKPPRGRPGAAPTWRISPDHRATPRSPTLIATSKSGLHLFLGAYPITPASSILEDLAGKKEFVVATFQAEDEIAAVGAAVGAAFGGALGVTASAWTGVVESGDRRPRDRARASARDPRHPAGRPVDRHADEAGAGDLRRLSSGRNGSPCPSWRRRRRRSASTRRSRLRASPRGTGHRSTCPPMPIWCNGSELAIPDVGALPDISTTFAEATDGPFEPIRADPCHAGPPGGRFRAPSGSSTYRAEEGGTLPH